MTKYLKFLVIAFSVFFIACGNDTNSKTNQAESVNSLQVIKIGATPNPHARILENIKDSDL